MAAEYCSCAHLSSDVVVKAMRKVKDSSFRSQDKFLTTNAFQCLECELIFDFKSSRLKEHMSLSNHNFALRVNSPHELYCFTCRDFQFSSLFDRFCKRKRSRSSMLQVKSNKRAGKGLSGQMKGLCNMGATCFMSAVLQILMKNTVLMSCDQLQLSVERCKSNLERGISSDAMSRQSGDSVAASFPQGPLPSCIYCEFKKLSAEADREGSGDTLIPAHLLYAVWNELDYMAGYQQQDAHEFLIAFLDGLDNHLKHNHSTSPAHTGHHSAHANGNGLSITIPGNAAASSCVVGPPTDCSPGVRKSPRSESKHRAFTPGSSTPSTLRRSTSDGEPLSNGSVSFVPRVAEVLDVFRGALQSRLTCQQCGHDSVKSEPFLDLSLSLSQDPSNGTTRATYPVQEEPTSTVSSVETMEIDVQAPLEELPRIAERESLGDVCAAPVVVDATPVKRGRGRPARAKNGLPSTPAAVLLEAATASASDAASDIALSEAGHASSALLMDEVGGEVSSGESDTTPHVALSDCMRAFTAMETLSEKIFCACCGSKQDTQKQFSISTPPNVLILHLKRFDILNDTKISTKVDIQVNNWDISEFTSGAQVQSSIPGDSADTPDLRHVSPGSGGAWSSAYREPWGSGDTLYDLQGLVSHSGTLHGGHYIAYAVEQSTAPIGKAGKKQWLRCDDENVTVVPEEEVREAEAYVLFYVKKKFQI